MNQAIDEEDKITLQKMLLEEFVGGIFKPWYNTKNKYYYAVKNGKIQSVHRMIAEKTLPNNPNLTDINHKDSQRWNNSPTNLERCSRSYNIKYSFDKNGRKPTWLGVKGKDNAYSKPIKATHRVTGEVLYYDSMHDAERDGWCISLVCRAAKKQRTHHKNYIWDYV